MMKKVLLTGASGFVGRHCIPLLIEQGFEVHAVSQQRQSSSASLRWHEINLLQEGAAGSLIEAVQPTHLLHFAWNAKPGHYWTAVDNFQWVRSSLDLLHSFAESGGQRVVMAGSCAEYDWDYGWCNENKTPLKPQTVYGTCKHSLQTMLGAYSQQFDLSSAWGRIFFLYGPFEYPSRLVSSVILALLQGQPASCSTGEQVRDFLHVADIASAFVALLGSNVQGPVNIASGQGLAIKDVVTTVAQKLNREDLLRLGAIATSPHDPPVLLADVRKLQDELNWKPSISLDYGLDATIEWWTSQLNKSEAQYYSPGS